MDPRLRTAAVIWIKIIPHLPKVCSDHLTAPRILPGSNRVMLILCMRSPRQMSSGKILGRSSAFAPFYISFRLDPALKATKIDQGRFLLPSNTHVKEMIFVSKGLKGTLLFTDYT